MVELVKRRLGGSVDKLVVLLVVGGIGLLPVAATFRSTSFFSKSLTVALVMSLAVFFGCGA
jgi:hypothetical protein